MVSPAEFVAAVEAEVGYTESPPGSNDNKYAVELGWTNGQSWCAALPSAIANRLGGVDIPVESPWTPAMADGFRNAGAWFTEPQVGDLAFFDFPDSVNRIQHVGTVKAWTDTTVTTIDGNTVAAAGSGSESNGGGVFVRTRPRSYVVGFGRPTFAGRTGLPVMTLTGPDISHHQGVVDMNAVAAEGHAFVGMKVDEGETLLDTQFRANRANARAAGLIRLLYHFARPSGTIEDARAEARAFFAKIGSLEVGEIAVLDIEAGDGDLSGWAVTFMDEVDRLTGRHGGTADDDSILYTYGPFARTHLRNTALGSRQLWLAAYTTSTPTAPAPWRAWRIWQYTSNGSCAGVAGRVDMNRFIGSIDDLNHMAGVSLTTSAATATTLSPPIQEKPVYKVTVDATPQGVLAQFVNPFGVTVPVAWEHFVAATAHAKGEAWAGQQNPFSPSEAGGVLVFSEPAMKVEVAFT